MPTVDWLAIWAVAERMDVRPIWLVVYHAPLVLSHTVPHSVIEIWKSIGVLAVAVLHRLLALLTTTIEIWVEEPMPRKNPNHRSHGRCSDPPIVVRRRVAKPSMHHLFIVVVGNDWVRHVLQEDRVTHAPGESAHGADVGV